MPIFSWLQRHFWVPMVAAVAAGYLLPGYGELLRPTFTTAIFIILTLVFVRIDLVDVLRHVRQPATMAYLLGMQQIYLPLVAYVIVLPFSPPLAAGVALLVAAPPAAAAPVFTDLLKGNMALCVSVYVLEYLAAPLTLTLVTGITLGRSVNLLPLFYTMVLLIFLPMITAQLAKRLVPRFINRFQPRFSVINLLVVTYLIFAIVSAQASQFRLQGWRILIVILGLYALFLVLHAAGYQLLWWRPEADRVAMSVSTTYMNTALAVVLAYKFFPPEVILVAVASEIPWSTVLGPVAWLYRRYRPA